VTSITRLSTCALIGGLAFAPLSRATAQGPSLGATVAVKASTLGFGPEIGFLFIPMLSIKVGANWATVSRDLTSSGIGYGADVKWRSYSILLDLHALGPVHFNGGVIRNGNELKLTATPTGSVTLGSTTYTSGQVGTITGTVGFKKAAPYLGMDFVMGGRVAFLLQLGAMFQGSPRITYTATPGSALPSGQQAAFDTAVQAEASQIQSDLDGRSYLKTWPVVGLGLQIKI